MTGPAERARLAELARAAQGQARYVPTTGRPSGWPTARQLDADGHGVWFGDDTDDAYIAAVSPDVILALLADIAALEAVASAAQGLVDAWDELQVDRGPDGFIRTIGKAAEHVTAMERARAALRALGGTE